MAEYFIEIVKLSYRVNLYCFFMTFPTLMTFFLFPEGSGAFPSLQQYNLGIGKGEGKVEGVEVKGMGSGWSCRPANSTPVCLFIC